MNDLVLRCLDTWPRVGDDFVFQRWTEDNTPVSRPFLREALEQGLWSKASNFVRLWALVNFGGIYLDTDFEILRSFEPLTRHEAFLGFIDDPSHPFCVSNAVCGSVPGHPFFSECFSVLERVHASSGVFAPASNLTTSILSDIPTRAPDGPVEISGVTVYPRRAFYPLDWRRTNPNHLPITPDTFAVHHWNRSWASPEKPKSGTMSGLPSVVCAGNWL
jgi:hypothetical protein